MPEVTPRIGGLAIFGLGIDGDLVQTGTLSLSRDMFYRNLTVNGTIETNGYRIFAQVNCTVGPSGRIKNNGGNAVSAVGGSGAPAGTVGGGQAGGTAPAVPGGFLDAIGGSGGVGGATSLADSKGSPYDNFFWTSGGHVIGAGAITLVKGGGGGAGVIAGLLSSGGGGGGGVVFISAKKLVVSKGGQIQANGGAAAVVGAGGGGGVVVIRAIELESRGKELLKFKANDALLSGIVAAGGSGAVPGNHGKVIIFAETGSYVQQGE